MRVRVIDKDGASNVYTSTLTVDNVAPSFTPTATTPVDEGKVASVSVDRRHRPVARRRRRRHAVRL